MNSQEIRSKFLSFFESKQHKIVPSAPMVIKNDPTLMFTNAGMNQFKDIFLGNSPAASSRIADSQKCLRVSGKHNDLEEVGHDTYHHTMFEMLGNWSFGDYFKKDAIAWAWEFLTKVCGVNPESLYVTVFGGDEKEGLGKDMEAFAMWEEFVPKERILFGSKKDNFWEMGDQGPCGPCSEIHADIRSDEEKAKIKGSELVNKDHPLVIEIWNLVFIQYNRLANGSLQPLAAKHVDTGMGFERLCMVLQGKQSNYDTDVFQPMIQTLAKMANKTYGNDTKADIAMRVCVDHLRAVAFAIADGQLPSNAKAGYVIRRILRRAVRYGYTFLGFKEPFMNRILPVLIDQMGTQFTELKNQQELIGKVILEEENSFLKTLEVGIQKFENHTNNLNGKTIDGHFAFELFDTFGFPIDLTQLMASEKGFTVDMKAFEEELDQQRQRSRQDAQVSTDDWVEIRQGNTVFVGYDCDEADIQILRYRKVAAKGKELLQLVFDQTPFYAEAGGQVGDSGTIGNANETIQIITTKKENNLNIHIVEKLPADLQGTFRAVVDVEKRRKVEANHTATHLLHFALRQVLGSHVEQKGSYVEDTRLRFDFSHFSKLTNEEMRETERIVNRLIRSNTALEEFREISIAEANTMGAIALFGEKYGDKVRIIKYGDSVEFCGGTHARSTGNIGMFKIVSEAANAAGIRRIEAVTGTQIEEMLYFMQDRIEAVRETLHSKQPDFIPVLQKVIEENESLHQALQIFQEEQGRMLKTRYLNVAEEINGVKIITDISTLSPDIIKDIAYQLRGELQDFIFVVGTNYGDKPMLTIMISDSLVKQGKNASTVIREAAKEINGGGGGQPFFATAGGKNTDGMETAVIKAKALLLDK